MSSLTRARPSGELPIAPAQDSRREPARIPVRACQPPQFEAPPIRTRPFDFVKSAADRLTALVLFIGSLPVMLVAGLLVKLNSRGPIVYSQVRLGRNGRPFWIYKIRTMYHDCEALTGAQWAVPGDPRITPIGRWLRRLHIDELPQLWNVLRGDMSLVGPRPERPEIANSLERAIPGYRGRLAVKPGLTGLAQIQLPADVDLDSVRDKLALDRCYIECYGAFLDTRILFGTALYLLGVSFAGVRRAMGLPTGERSPLFQSIPEPT